MDAKSGKSLGGDGAKTRWVYTLSPHPIGPPCRRRNKKVIARRPSQPAPQRPTRSDRQGEEGEGGAADGRGSPAREQVPVGGGHQGSRQQGDGRAPRGDARTHGQPQRARAAHP
eukprot:7015167-Pyramimonas_sp.AAC.1